MNAPLGLAEKGVVRFHDVQRRRRGHSQQAEARAEGNRLAAVVADLDAQQISGLDVELALIRAPARSLNQVETSRLPSSSVSGGAA